MKDGRPNPSVHRNHTVHGPNVVHLTRRTDGPSKFPQKKQVRREIEDGEECGSGLLDAQDAGERPLAVELGRGKAPRVEILHRPPHARVSALVEAGPHQPKLDERLAALERGGLGRRRAVGAVAFVDAVSLDEGMIADGAERRGDKGSDQGQGEERRRRHFHVTFRGYGRNRCALLSYITLFLFPLDE